MRYGIIFLLTLFLSGCKSNDDPGVVCTEIFVYGLNIMVRDADTDALLVQNLTVTATDGSYSEDLFLNFDTFLGAGERPGNYVINITADGYQPFESGVLEVTLTPDACHVIPISRVFLLQPD